jgi:hypothetical protein
MAIQRSRPAAAAGLDASMLRPAFLVEGHVAHAPGLGLAQVFTACIAAVGGRLLRRLAIEGDVALQ